MTFIRRSHASSANNESEAHDKEHALVADANASPVAYPGPSLTSFGATSRFAVRQIGADRFVVTHEMELDKAFYVDSVYPGGHVTLESAKQEVDRSTRDWREAANEDRQDALDAQSDDEADERY